jgi:hypothetical protein
MALFDAERFIGGILGKTGFGDRGEPHPFEGRVRAPDMRTDGPTPIYSYSATPAVEAALAAQREEEKKRIEEYQRRREEQEKQQRSARVARSVTMREVLACFPNQLADAVKRAKLSAGAGSWESERRENPDYLAEQIFHANWRRDTFKYHQAYAEWVERKVKTWTTKDGAELLAHMDAVYLGTRPETEFNASVLEESARELREARAKEDEEKERRRAEEQRLRKQAEVEREERRIEAEQAAFAQEIAELDRLRQPGRGVW